jgi:nicotinate-nucleotide pyrophosphorylase (carboxylating)
MLEPSWLESCLREDIGDGDVTTEALIVGDKTVEAFILPREAGVACGLDLAKPIAQALGGELEDFHYIEDGSPLVPGENCASFRGSHALLLKVERLYLNLIQRLCGVATTTQKYVDAISHTKAKILDTRKTAPGMRALEKRAVLAGGGQNHRMGLFDAFLIKENHLQAYRNQPNPFLSALEAARCSRGDLPLIIEVESLEEMDLALEGLPDVILLDNFSVDQMKEAVLRLSKLNEVPLLEASGGIRLETLAGVAEAGVDRISVGAITHSARPLDLSLLIRDI